MDLRDWTTIRGDVIVCCGGYEGRYQLDTVEAYSDSMKAWAQMPSMPKPRDSMAAGSLGKIIILAGGSDRKIPYDYVMLFDWLSQSWEKSTPLTTARASPASVMDKSGGRLLVSGGFNNVALKSTEAFDMQTEKWVSLPDMPSARAKSGAAMAGGHFFVVGGEIYGRSLNLVEAFNVKENKWITLPSMRSKRRRCAVAGFDDKIIVSGGLTSDGITLDTMELFDMRNRKWLELPNMPCARFGCGACVVNNRMFLLGGNEKLKMKSCCDRCDAFDLVSHSWERVPPMIHRRLHTSAVHVTI
ncbi:predicted protein [Nematostella vectensis]|uniref:Uncharacterized protein n=2 Tax=Nematostella vectensis TaxID=45351 RepID=A7RHG1_NEMVE|nr:predicted protein [Nematostella vectensis]|eukprot:XP_001641284.1 predicted protein [Nematostella vectensis]